MGENLGDPQVLEFGANVPRAPFGGDPAGGALPRRDESVPRRFAAGDELAAREIRDRIDRILAFRAFSIPAEDRRDLRQEVITQVFQAVRRDGFDFQQGFWGFVETVVTRRVIDWRRSRRTVVELDPGLSDRGESAVDGLIVREQVSLGRAVLERLDAKCRDLIARHAVEGLPYRQIAVEQGISEGALRVQLHRCVKRARTLLQAMLGARLRVETSS